MKILYAEDDESSRYFLETLLKSQGHTIVSATDGEAALGILKNESFELIISDILMPLMDGFTLCFQVRGESGLANIPFIFYSATYTQPDDIHFAMQLGADRFLIKPVAPEQLLQEIDNVMVQAKKMGTTHQSIDEKDFFIGHEKRLGHKLQSTRDKLNQTQAELNKIRHDLDEARRIQGLLVDHSSDAVLVVDRRGRLVSKNFSLLKLFNFTNEKLDELSLNDLLPSDRCQDLLALLDIPANEQMHDFNNALSINGVPIFITTTVVHHQDQCALLIILRNIRGYAGFIDHMEIHQHVLKNLTEGVIITDRNNCIISVNPAFTQITGYSAEEVLGKNPRILKSGSQDLPFYRRMWATLLTEGKWQGEVWNRRKNGELFPEWLFISVVRDQQGDILFHVGIFNDVSEHEESRKRIEHLAHHDPLTDTPNRTLIRYRLSDSMLQANRSGHKVALLFVDIDRFKSINDSLGHLVGDEVIKLIAQRLRSSVRQADTVGRQGGDEFVVVLVELPGVAEVKLVADKILKSIARPCFVDRKEIIVTTSIGIALYPDDGRDEMSLIKNADAALYKAKSDGRNNFQFYHSSLNQMAEQQLTMENALHHAVSRGELRLVYQPQIRMIDNAIVGCEILVRWRNPELGDVPPAVFIPVAEDTGKINTIGNWILATACHQASKWMREDMPEISFAINLSAIQFRQPTLINEIRQVLVESGLSAQLLELELTEGILMREAHNTLETLRHLKEMQIQLSIDDFGTGYSNLGYLNRFSVDKIKIDQSFVRGLPDNKNDLAIVQAIIQMGHSLGLVVIAEGVETADQRDVLKELGCELAQGYFYAKPLESDEFEKLLRKSVTEGN